MKKKLMAAICIIMSVIMLFSSTGFAASAANDQLRFGSDGKFVILQLTDTQDKDEPQDTMIAFIKQSLDTVKPDLVVFTGDNQVADGREDENKVYEAIKAIIEPVQEKGIPFAIAFGNHDQEKGVTKERQMEMYQSFDGCLANDDNADLYGCGTYNLTIKSSVGNKDAFNLWFFDSGSSNPDGDGYDYVRKDQVDWYVETSKALEQSNGAKVPSIAFQHIIVPEIYEAIFVSSPFSLGSLGKTVLGKHYTFQPKFDAYKGIILEPPCPSYYSDGEFDAWVERGDVIAAAFGHDHINSFIAPYKGIDLVQTPGITYNSYGREVTRGARVFTIDENDPWNYETSVYHVYDAAREDGSSISDTESGKSGFFYTFAKIAVYLMNMFMNILSKIAAIF